MSFNTDRRVSTSLLPQVAEIRQKSNNLQTPHHGHPSAALNHPHYNQPPHLQSLHQPAAFAAQQKHQDEGDTSKKLNAPVEEEYEEINVQVRETVKAVFFISGELSI